MQTEEAMPRSARSFKGRRLLIVVGAIVLVVLALVVVAGLVFRGEYATTQAVERSFVIKEDFTKVRKILVRTDATKQIVTMTGDSEFVDQHWNTIGAGLEGERLLDLKWELGLEGTLLLRTRDPYIGDEEIELRQQVHINPDQIHSEVTLIKPSERLLQYEMNVSFERQAGSTVVHQRLKQEILTDAPWFAHGIADRRVRASAETALENQEAAIRKIVAENQNQRWLLFD